jgi:hypothetical protein
MVATQLSHQVIPFPTCINKPPLDDVSSCGVLAVLLGYVGPAVSDSANANRYDAGCRGPWAWRTTPRANNPMAIPAVMWDLPNSVAANRVLHLLIGPPPGHCVRLPPGLCRRLTIAYLPSCLIGPTRLLGAFNAIAPFLSRTRSASAAIFIVYSTDR